ncbi:MAG: acylphosphatase [Candidatus Paceibacteria bacterium]
MKAVKLKIYGRVQGVFFRHSARQVAKNLRISGWVRNADDGTVEILASGDEAELQEFISWCHKGPILARVRKVEIDYQVEAPPYKEFKII